VLLVYIDILNIEKKQAKRVKWCRSSVRPDRLTSCHRNRLLVADCDAKCRWKNVERLNIRMSIESSPNHVVRHSTTKTVYISQSHAERTDVRHEPLTTARFRPLVPSHSRAHGPMEVACRAGGRAVSALPSLPRPWTGVRSHSIIASPDILRCDAAWTIGMCTHTYARTHARTHTGWLIRLNAVLFSNDNVGGCFFTPRCLLKRRHNTQIIRLRCVGRFERTFISHYVLRRYSVVLTSCSTLRRRLATRTNACVQDRYSVTSCHPPARLVPPHRSALVSSNASLAAVFVK